MNSAPRKLRLSNSRPSRPVSRRPALSCAWMAMAAPRYTLLRDVLEMAAAGRVEHVHGAGLGRQRDRLARMEADALLEHGADLRAQHRREQDGLGAGPLDPVELAP